MSDKLPSLFDFDDEEFFPNTELKSKSEGNKNEENAPETGEMEALNEPVQMSGDAIAGELSGEDENELPVVAMEGGKTPEDRVAIQERLTVIPEKNQGNAGLSYVKPKLELPQSVSNEIPNLENAGDTTGQMYDKQINAFTVAFKPAFIFEPRKSDGAAQVEERPLLSQDKQSLEKVEATEGTPDIAEPEEAENDLGSASELPDWELDKNYYTIGEVAHLFEVKVSHIRFWATEFKIKTRTTRKGDRLFTPAQIAELRLIHHLVKVKKHTLKGAKEALQQEGSVQLEKKLDLREELLKLHQALLEIKNGLV